MARRQTTPLGGLLAGTLVFAYPVLFYAAGRFFPQSLAGFLLVLLVLLLAEARSGWAFVATGIVFGVLILTVPLFVFHLVVSVWSVRNYLAFGAFIFLTTASGATLLWGNSPYATIGSADVDFLFRYYAEASALSEVERNAYFTAEAFKYIREHKLETLGFYLLKVANHFNFYNEHFASSEASRLRTLIILLTYGPLLALLIVRLLQWRRFPLGRIELLLVVLYVSAAFVYAIFHTRIRYRVPFDYLLVTLAGMHLDRLVRAWLDRPSAVTVP